MDLKFAMANQAERGKILIIAKESSRLPIAPNTAASMAGVRSFHIREEQQMLMIPIWEFTVSYRLGREAEEITRCRERVRKALPRWGLEEHADVAELIVDELASNAQRRSHCPIEVNLSYDGVDLRIEVWDSADSMPEPQQPSADDETGRGLQIVDGLAAEYGGARGIARRDTRAGKTVFVTLPIQLSASFMNARDLYL
jgi:signal transduction histidine kinase